MNGDAELLEAMARLICEWSDTDPDTSLGGDKQNFLWQEVAETLAEPLLRLVRAS